MPEGLWIKCPSCEAVLYRTDLEKNLSVCPKCNHHARVAARERIDQLLDPEGRFEIGSEVLPIDSLKFKDTAASIRSGSSAALEETGETDALVVMQGSIKSMPLVLAAFEFEFMGGSMGSVVGERFVRGVRVAYENRVPFVCITASGRRAHAGRRQLAVPDGQDDGGLQELSKARLPFVSILTDPTMGGVSASVRDDRRCRHRRARRADRLRGPARDRADGARKAAGGLPARRVPAGKRRDRHDRRPASS